MAYGIYENGAVIAAFVAPMRVISNKPIFVSDTLSLKRTTFSRSAQRWEIETNLEPLVETANTLFVNLVTKGKSETLTVLMPQNYAVTKKRTSTSTAPTAIAVAGASSASGIISTSDVVVAANSGLIPKGSFIKFANHDKVYMTVSDLTNTGVLTIFPTLQATVSSTVFAFKDDVILKGIYDTDTITGMVYTDGIMMDMGTVKIVEKL
jgi:hypothetical protein